MLRLEIIEGRPRRVGLGCRRALVRPLAPQPPIAQQRHNIFIAGKEYVVPVRIIKDRRMFAQLRERRVGVGDKGGVVQVEVEFEHSAETWRGRRRWYRPQYTTNAGRWRFP